MNFFPITQKKSSAGFALLYATIVVAVVSSLGAVLSSLIVREADLSATARESSRAYYSADAAMECAQYWDLQEDHFPRSLGPPGDIACASNGNKNITVSATTTAAGDEKYEFTINNSSLDICADVDVVKKEDGSRKITQINAFGKDICSGSTRVERALRTTY
jgi:type II secretory pathway pseudopilin PulG